MEALCYGRGMLKLSHSSAETWQAYKEAGCAYIAALGHNSCEWECHTDAWQCWEVAGVPTHSGVPLLLMEVQKH